MFSLRSRFDAARSLALRRRELGSVEGLRFSRLVFVGAMRSEGFTIGPVDPRRQLAMCLWDDAAALDRFLERSPIADRWRQRSDQYCELRMTPFRTHGSYLGREPLAGLTAAPARDGPVALWTFADIPLRGLAYFWSGIRRATPRLIASPGLVAGTAGPERLYRGAMTYTIWESLDAALEFAYRAPPHNEIVRRVRTEALLKDSMFIRFRPYAAAGEWPRWSRFADRFERLERSLAASAVAA